MLLEIIIRLTAAHCEAEPANITADTAFKSLGMDSLDITEMILDLEEELGMSIDYSVDAKVKTVGEVAGMVEQMIG